MADRTRIVSESYHEPGSYVTVVRDKRNTNPGILMLLRGGLGDVRSSSMGTIANKAVRMSEGEAAVGFVRTVRPLWLPRAISESINARETRADGMDLAIARGAKLYQPEIIVVGGHSQGGITAVDGTKKFVQRPGSEGYGKAVVTIDSPGIYEELERDENIAIGLAKLGAHCVREIFEMSNLDRYRMFQDAVRRGFSPFELLHVLGEISYLKDIDIRDEIGDLEASHVSVWHMFHDKDIVPGAVTAQHYPNAEVFSGSHLRAIHGDGATETARALIDIAFTMYDDHVPNRPLLLGA